MSWWGGLVGGAIGASLGGPLGAIFGAVLGVKAARFFGEEGQGAPDALADSHEPAQAAFFAATFGVMGHIAKADGHVSADEIRLANHVMDEFDLTAEQRRAARAIFGEGKKPSFPLDAVLRQLRAECGGRASNLLRLFLEIQIHLAWADGGVDAAERRLLLHSAERLGFHEDAFLELERMVAAAAGLADTAADENRLADAYATLGVSPDAPDDEVKRAYRRLMNRHHPDKLAAKGLPEEMMRAAIERTQQIRAAWECVQASRQAAA